MSFFNHQQQLYMWLVWSVPVMTRPRLEELISRPRCCSWDTSSSRLSCSPSSSSPTTVTSQVSKLCMISSDTTVSWTKCRTGTKNGERTGTPLVKFPAERSSFIKEITVQSYSWIKLMSHFVSLDPVKSECVTAGNDCSCLHMACYPPQAINLPVSVSTSVRVYWPSSS